MSKLIPTIREIAYPESAADFFAPLAGLAGSFWLDSSLADGRLGRWSLMGARPFRVLSCRGSQVELEEGARRMRFQGDPFLALKRLLAAERWARRPGMPPFVGGAVGWFGYDLRHFVERSPRQAVDDLGLPDLRLGFYRSVLALDHLERRAFICGHPDHLEIEQRWLLDTNLTPRSPSPLTETPGTGELSANFSRSGYLRAVGRVKEYIAAGDIYQANLSQRLTAALGGDPWALYLRLREASPAPFSAYLRWDDLALASSSPERFIAIRGGRVETRPIKGTRPRAANPREDARLAEELLTSPKDRAENVMIVDLERNDLGRVCRYGSVRVSELCALERYANVFHLVSTVIGELRPEVGPVDCLRACFPGGSITGAPKVRAMEIIDELEPTARGPYTGAIGYLCFTGEMDTNIAIRTFVVKDGRGHLQVGGGIVADSDPEAEYQETLDKALGGMAALGFGSELPKQRKSEG